MSAGPVGRREVAVRCFAAEYDDADLSYSESDEERAPNYVVTPTGARINRLFAVGVLTEVEPVSDDVLRGRVVDPTGAFVVYAGQYQPDAKTALERIEPPAFVAVTGKARTFEPDDGDRIYTSVRPESITAVDAATRDRWTVQAAEQTVARVATCAAALDREERGAALQAVLEAAGVEAGLAAGIPRAIEHYGTTPAYLSAVRTAALQAAEVVAGERDEVDPLAVAPDEGGPVEVDLAGDVSLEGVVAEAAPAEAAATVGGESAAEPAGEPAVGDASPGDGGSARPTDAGPDEPAPGADDDDAPPAEAAEPTPAEPDAAPAEYDETEATGPAGEPAEATAAEDEPADDEPLGDFDDGSSADGAGAEEPALEAASDYELDEEEIEAVEAEFGTEFSTGNEVDPAGAADIESEAPEEDDAETAEPDADEADETGPAPEPAGDDGDVDLVDAAVAAMASLDDGDGAERTAVVETVAAEHGVEPAAVEEAIGEALMGGRCYEPDDEHLTAI